MIPYAQRCAQGKSAKRQNVPGAAAAAVPLSPLLESAVQQASWSGTAQQLPRPQVLRWHSRGALPHPLFGVVVDRGRIPVPRNPPQAYRMRPCIHTTHEQRPSINERSGGVPYVVGKGRRELRAYVLIRKRQGCRCEHKLEAPLLKPS